jgi:lysophospholipase L1-like esterase
MRIGATWLKTILVFGDSNTWGHDPETGLRLPVDKRWPGVLRQSLGLGYEVIEEGLAGRTTVFNDPLEPYKSGKEYLPPCLLSHSPIDLVILLLGTNDVQTRYNVSALEISLGIGVLVELIQASASGPGNTAPEVLLISPPPIGTVPEEWAESYIGAETKSRHLAKYYQRIADEYQCEFYDAAQSVVSSESDGVHWDADQHEKLGKALAPLVRLLSR